MQSDAAIYAILAVKVVFLFLILLGGVLFPLVCTAILWNKEKRLQIFVYETNNHRSELETQLWNKCKIFSKLGIGSCVGLGILLLLHK